MGGDTGNDATRRRALPGAGGGLAESPKGKNTPQEEQEAGAAEDRAPQGTSFVRSGAASASRRLANALGGGGRQSGTAADAAAPAGAKTPVSLRTPGLQRASTGQSETTKKPAAHQRH